MRSIRITLVIALLIGSGSLAFSSAAATLDERTREIAAQLRCPVCQNLSVADSQSELAKRMQVLIREKLEAGETPEQIQAYFVEKYGEWILLSPTPQGWNLLVWILPPLFLVGGGLMVGLVIKQWMRKDADARQHIPSIEEGSAASVPSTERRYRERLRQELEEYE